MVWAKWYNDAYDDDTLDYLDQRYTPLAQWELADDSQTNWLKDLLARNYSLGLWGLFFTLSWATVVWVLAVLMNR